MQLDELAISQWRDDANSVTPEQGAGKEKGSEPPEPLLPSWRPVQAVNPPKRNPALIEGVVRRAHVISLVGKGKGSKTWTAIQFAVAVATGGEWFKGSGLKCIQGNVLYIDPELDSKSLDNRFREVALARGDDPVDIDQRVMQWPLRGVVTSEGRPPFIEDLVNDIRARCSYGDFDLVVIDSASCFVSGDENSSHDIRAFFNQANAIAETTGATVLVVHHMGKGAKGDVDAIERARGSSTWGDAPDTPFSMLEIFPPGGKEVTDYLEDGERAFVLDDSGLREFPSIKPLHVIFHHPIHRVDTDGITAEWKPKSGQRDGGNATAKVRKLQAAERAHKCCDVLAAEFIAKGIGKEGITAKEATQIVNDELDETIKDTTLKGYIEKSDVFRVEQTSRQRWRVVPRVPPVESPEQTSLDV